MVIIAWMNKKKERKIRLSLGSPTWNDGKPKIP